MIFSDMRILKLGFITTLLFTIKAHTIFAEKVTGENSDSGQDLNEVGKSSSRHLYHYPSATPPCHGHNCNNHPTPCYGSNCNGNNSPTLPCSNGGCGCSQHKRVKISQFCILYDSGLDDQHQIQLNGSPYYPVQGYVIFKEGQCHALPHHVKWEKILSYNSFTVGTDEFVGNLDTNDYSVELHPNDWYNPTCDPYEIKVAVEHTSWKRHSTCWNFPDPNGCGTCNKCTPDWHQFRQSFEWVITVEPDGPGCGDCHHCGGCPPPEVTPVPTREPTQVPTREPTQVPTKEPTQVPTREPTQVPTKEPTQVPTKEPTTPPPTTPPPHTPAPTTPAPTTPAPTCPHCSPRHEYYILNTNTKKYLDNEAGACQNGNNVHLWAFHGRENQRWYDGPNGTIMSVNCPNMVLDIQGMSCEPGTNLYLWSFTGDFNQQLNWNGPEIFNNYCNVALDIVDYGQNVITWTRTGYSHQCWQKIYVGHPY